MAAYLYGNIEITDPVLYETYRAQVPALIALRQRAARGSLVAVEGV
ncbi:MAG: hypothetical protein Q8K45_11545 [Rubrivivax sp.]|nr:hypothetical protein [Rubrivivax sp.]